MDRLAAQSKRSGQWSCRWKCGRRVIVRIPFKRGFGKSLGSGLNTAPGHLLFEVASRGNRQRREEVPQVVPQDERALPALSGFEVSIADCFVKFRSADAGHGAGF